MEGVSTTLPPDGPPTTIRVPTGRRLFRARFGPDFLRATFWDSMDAYGRPHAAGVRGEVGQGHALRTVFLSAALLGPLRYARRTQARGLRRDGEFVHVREAGGEDRGRHRVRRRVAPRPVRHRVQEEGRESRGRLRPARPVPGGAGAAAGHDRDGHSTIPREDQLHRPEPGDVRVHQPRAAEAQIPRPAQEGVLRPGGAARGPVAGEDHGTGRRRVRHAGRRDA